MATRTAGKLGKLPATRPYGISDLGAYLMHRPPAPPAAVSAPAVASWPMAGNDQYGDCVFAGSCHAIQAWNAEVSEHDAVPADQAVVDAYLAYTGGEDVGANISQVLRMWQRKGLFGQKIAAFAPVNEKSIADLHMAIAFYGNCKIGIQCPESAQEQFGEGKPWTVVPGSPIEGGHDIELVGYDANCVYAVTWGAVVEVTYPFIAKFCDEAWAVIPHQFVEAGKGPALDLKSLQADINSLR